MKAVDTYRPWPLHEESSHIALLINEYLHRFEDDGKAYSQLIQAVRLIGTGPFDRTAAEAIMEYPVNDEVGQLARIALGRWHVEHGDIKEAQRIAGDLTEADNPLVVMEAEVLDNLISEAK